MANYTPQQIEEFLREFFDVVGTRQYVGARYVPLFGRRGEDTIEWDDTAPYEPLTVVTHLGNSYTSRQYVPMGVAITDTDFWANTGNYNAQVEAYRAEVLAIRQDWQDWQTATEAEIGQWEDDTVASLNQWKGTTEDEYREIAESTNLDIAPGIAVVFGDSIARGFGLNAGERWSSQFCLLAGLTEYNYAVDGASFTENIYQQVETAAVDSRFDNEDVRYVLVSGGINDHGKTYPQIYNGIRTFCVNAQTTFPNAVYIALPCLCASKPIDNINQGDNQYMHSEAIEYVYLSFTQDFGRWICPRDCYRWLTGQPQYAQDNVHPSALGAKVIASLLYAELRGGHGQRWYSRITIPKADNAPITVLNGLVETDGYSYQGIFNFTCDAEIPAGNIDLTKEIDVLMGTRNKVKMLQMIKMAYGENVSIPVYLLNGKIKQYGVAIPAGEYSVYFFGVLGL